MPHGVFIIFDRLLGCHCPPREGEMRGETQSRAMPPGVSVVFLQIVMHLTAVMFTVELIFLVMRFCDLYCFC